VPLRRIAPSSGLNEASSSSHRPPTRQCVLFWSTIRPSTTPGREVTALASIASKKKSKKKSKKSMKKGSKKK
jgi:hypothetical protein